MSNFDFHFLNRSKFCMHEVNEWLLNTITKAPDKLFRDISIKAYHYLSDFEKIDLYINYREK